MQRVSAGRAWNELDRAVMFRLIERLRPGTHETVQKRSKDVRDCMKVAMACLAAGIRLVVVVMFVDVYESKVLEGLCHER